MGIDGAIQLIVEGPGDRGAVPTLLRKRLHELEDFRPGLLATPIAVNGISNLTKAGGIEGYVRIAASRPGAQQILVVIDADKECIKQVATGLLPRCGSRVPVTLAIAEKNFEDWIYASCETTIHEDAVYEVGANGLSRIRAHRDYTKSVDQATLAANIEIHVAAGRNGSFKRLIERFDAIATTVTVA
ncbi:hypothetical protein [Agrococcus carbonis]|uniref:DUF4276 family protein n=1 Tax=Agrococcus carbonis TaxID=684552 RepID=A0A1H1R2Q6_9MICO|nr:hypothetical protein [Agrococcus carbonis]SDS30047.1 hypothetical protein SAMN04489719_2000 [Agrococcus carbonis]